MSNNREFSKLANSSITPISHRDVCFEIIMSRLLDVDFIYSKITKELDTMQSGGGNEGS
mgnify:CR=1 FL=1